MVRDGAHYHAATQDDVEREFRASVDDYLAFCEEEGRASDFALQRHIANTIAREASEHGIACYG